MKAQSVSWKVLGQLVNWIVNLYSLIRDTFTAMQVGIEILPWLLDEGKESLVKSLESLGNDFLKTQRIKVIDENTILVNLGASPKLPFKDAEQAWHEGTGWVKLQKRRDGLFYAEIKSDGQFGDNRKIVLYRSDRQ